MKEYNSLEFDPFDPDELEMYEAKQHNLKRCPICDNDYCDEQGVCHTCQKKTRH